MAIQVSGTEVISNSRALNNIASVDATTAAAIGNAGVGGAMVLLVDNASASGATYIEVSFTADYRMYIVQFCNVTTNSTDFSARYKDSSGNLISSTNYYVTSKGGSYNILNTMFMAPENSRPVDGYVIIHDPYSTTNFSVNHSNLIRAQDHFFGWGAAASMVDGAAAARHNGISFYVGQSSVVSSGFTGGHYNVWGVTAP